MNKTNLFILPALAATMLQFGCTSYSFRGAHSDLPTVQAPIDQQYRLNDYKADIHKGNTCSITRWGGTFVTQEDIEKKLTSSYPERFSKNPKATPINVSVECTESKSSRWGVLTYFLTLGFYPANVWRYEERCLVDVGQGGKANHGEIRFRSNWWLSAFNPAGSNTTDNPDNYNGSYRHGGGIMSVAAVGSECFERQKDTYISEVAAEINVSVIELGNEQALKKAITTAQK